MYEVSFVIPSMLTSNSKPTDINIKSYHSIKKIDYTHELCTAVASTHCLIFNDCFCFVTHKHTLFACVCLSFITTPAQVMFCPHYILHNKLL